MSQIKEMKIDEFSRRLRNLVETADSKFVFFLGAGCSVSSGIPHAGTLVRSWLPRLKKLKTGSEDDYKSWVKEIYTEYEDEKASSFYGRVIEDLFLTPEERQREIERLTEGKDPGFGYAVLAQIITNDKYCPHCSVVLTVNFDDLVADALYLYTNKKPLVISHDSLAGFVKITRTRPLIIKLHGDARLEPKNTEQETKDLAESVKKVLKNLLNETGLIFIGYGGHDESIAEILNELPVSALPWGIYWIASKIPESKTGEWLKSRDAVWVNHLDFDELMLILWKEFNLSHPQKDRFDKLIETYYKTFEKLSRSIEAKPEEKIQPLKEALDKAKKDITSWWAVELEAEKYKKENPEKADSIYKEGIERFPNSPELLGSYAIFLKNIRKDNDKAEEYYQRSIEKDPNSAISLGSYALFLKEIRKDNDKAEEYYKRSLEKDPNDATNLGNYANFLKEIRKENDKAEGYYQRSIEKDPNDAINLGNYALFLEEIRKDNDKAEGYYQRSIEKDPNNAINLGNYALFLHQIRKENDKAEGYYQRSIEKDPNNAINLGNYALFLHQIRKDNDKAEEYYKRSLEKDPNNAINLGNYALFLHQIRKDNDKAEEYYKRSLEKDLNNANNLGNYAIFLKNIRKEYNKAEEYYRKALEKAPDHANNLGNYAGFLLSRGNEKGFKYLEKSLDLSRKDISLKTQLLECLFYQYAHSKDENLQKESLKEIKSLLKEGARSPGWDLSDNVKKGIEDGHPYPAFLEKLSKVISEEIEIKELDNFEIWRELD